MTATRPAALRAGAACVLILSTNTGTGEYPSRIEEVDTGRVWLAMPIRRGSLVPRLEPVPILIARVLAAAAHTQRTHVRVATALRPGDAAVWLRGASGLPGDGEWRPVQGMLLDLSGGGMALRVPEEVAPQSRVWLRFPLPAGGGDFATLGRVMACRRSGEGQSAQFILGIQFDEVKRPERERLIKATHRLQVLRRRLAQGQQPA